MVDQKVAKIVADSMLLAWQMWLAKNQQPKQVYILGEHRFEWR